MGKPAEGKRFEPQPGDEEAWEQLSVKIGDVCAEAAQAGVRAPAIEAILMYHAAALYKATVAAPSEAEFVESARRIFATLYVVEVPKATGPSS